MGRPWGKTLAKRSAFVVFQIDYTALHLDFFIFVESSSGACKEMVFAEHIAF